MPYPPDCAFHVHILGEGGRPTRSVNIMTQSGADAFIGSGKPYIANNLENDVDKYRLRMQQTQQQLSRQERNETCDRLETMYVMFDCIADCSTPSVFAKIPTTELQTLVDHAITVFSELSISPRWTKTGVLIKYDQKLLDCLINYCKHWNFVQLLIVKKKKKKNSSSKSNDDDDDDNDDHDLLKVLAKFIAARVPGMPCADVTETIVYMMNNIRVTLEFDQDWSAEKIFRMFESSAGMLGQLIRCLSQPPKDIIIRGTKSYEIILDELAKCTLLIQKKLCQGSDTGLILDNVIAGKDGYTGRRQDEVMTRLINLKKAAALNQTISSLPGNVGIGQTCRYCNKAEISKDFQEKLLLCSRCKNTYYCSKACQRADWPSHKTTCKPLSKQFQKATPGHQSAAMVFLQNNYYEIMKMMELTSRDGKVAKKDLLLEVDLMVDPTKGSAPGLRTPPEFKMASAKSYMDGQRPNEPDWFFKGTEVYKNNINNMLSGLRDHYSRMTDDRILTLVRHPSGDSSVYRICLMAQETDGKALFSDEALQAFRRAIVHKDDSQLSNVYSPEQIISIISRRDYESRRAVLGRGGVEFQQDMAALAQRCRTFMMSDEWKKIQEECGDDDDDDDDDEDDDDSDE